MILFKQAKNLTDHIAQLKKEGKTIGFVPTMGALHDGHLSLLSGASKEADIVICSIFINPTQFNNADDFNKYPTIIEQDIDQLVSSDCDILFLPSREEIYPENYVAPHYELGALETVLEGRYRPGHFQGVCQVVDRLLQIVDPEFLLLGQKDYQQCKVIQKLLSTTERTNTSLIISPTIREKDGLAMSSRNLRLSKEQRAKASALYLTLQQAQIDFKTIPVTEIKYKAFQELTKKGFRVDYFEIVSATTLQPSNGFPDPMIALVGAYIDDIRLIDNLPLN